MNTTGNPADREADRELGELERWEVRRAETTTRYASKVSALLDRRPELRGISPLADTIEESVRWAV